LLDLCHEFFVNFLFYGFTILVYVFHLGLQAGKVVAEGYLFFFERKKDLVVGFLI